MGWRSWHSSSRSFTSGAPPPRWSRQAQQGWRSSDYQTSLTPSTFDFGSRLTYGRSRIAASVETVVLLRISTDVEPMCCRGKPQCATWRAPPTFGERLSRLERVAGDVR
jgi:hypothetical protein